MSMGRLSMGAEAVGGRLIGADAGFDSVSTDSRSIEPGQLFFALRGTRHDAADYARDAAAAGAAGVVIETPQDIRLPQVHVADAGEALRTFATNWRRRFSLPIVAVTGSNGKTTVKEMVGTILRTHFAGPGEDAGVLVTWGNLNNHIGVPITLLWMRDSHHAAVIEMGASAKREIARLAAIAAPGVAIITNAGPAHLGGFGGTLRDVAEAKGELVAGLPAGSTAVINRDDPFYGYWRGLRDDITYRSFGLSADADYRAVDVQASGLQGLRFRLLAPAGEIAVKLPMSGSHNVRNALAAAAASLAAGASLESVRDGLGQMLNVAGRLRAEPGPAGSTIFDDSYNANPGSVAAAIQFLAGLDGQRWLVLGGMAELGPDEAALHREIGTLAARSGIDRFYCVGELTRPAAEGFGAAAHWYADVDELADVLRPQMTADVRLLVKGSRSAGLERLVQSVTGRSGQAGAH
ncbi:MAG: UDP-N-acetylmuramoyl-tripeptide--D-alanyl-D-alanine ligase [Gammaproteobacteria bacterium]|nr:UDP-N-acetylmuramoyl-tripeptide--D-alanyl-D-alanine ligase [Gammaproteobacteria bacterium]